MTLDLSGNAFRTFDFDTFSLPALRYLYLEDSAMLTTVTGSVLGSLPSLEMVYLEGSNVTFLSPLAFWKLGNLTYMCGSGDDVGNCNESALECASKCSGYDYCKFPEGWSHNATFNCWNFPTASTSFFESWSPDARGGFVIGAIIAASFVFFLVYRAHVARQRAARRRAARYTPLY
eukprot:m.410182 g.410182  ORF g.410182 m.410182 type:complete len:176 (+) comp56531_c0_seq12:357-884(+)